MRSFKAITFVLLGSAAIAVGVYFSYREWNREKQIEREVESLRQEAEKIRTGNQNLKDRIAYFETDDFKEGIAKEKLNLQKPDEKVVYIKPDYFSSDSDNENKVVFADETAEKIPNYKKWWLHFFAFRQ